MSKEMIVSVNGREKKIAILDNGKVTEFYIERGEENAGVVGNVYKGRVMRVLPGMQSAFVDIGLERDAFLYVSDFFDEEEEIERIVMEKSKKESPEEAQRSARDQIDRSRIEREKQMEAVQEIVEPLDDGSAPAEEEAFEPRSETVEQKPDRSKRGRGGRGRKDRDEEPRAEIEAAPEPAFEIEFDNSGFERISDDEDTGDMFKDAYMQEAIIDRVRAVEFEMESTAVAEVGSLLAEVGGQSNGFERIADEDEETTAPAKGRGRSKSGKSTTPADKPKSEKPPAKKSSSKPGTTSKGKKAKSEEKMEDAEASLMEADGHAEMAVRRGGRGRRRGGKPKTKTDSDTDESGESVDADEMVGDEIEENVHIEDAPVEIEPDAAAETERTFDAEPETTSEPTADSGEPNNEERQARGDSRRGGRGRGGRTERGDRSNRPTGDDERPANEMTGTDNSEVASRDRPSNDRSERPSGSSDRPSGDRQGGERSERPEGNNERPNRGRNVRPSGSGNRFDRNSRDRAPQPTISDLLKEGQEILVQIAKEPIAKKGARITSHIAMPGRFLVYMPTIEHLGVSRKIESSNERARLRTLIQRIRQDATIPSGGFIVRTAGIGISEEDLRNDAKFLVRTWIDAKKDSEKKKSPAMIHQDLDLVQRLLRDQLSDDFTAIRVDSEEEYLRTVEFMNRMAPRMVNRVKLYTRDEPILDAYGVQEEVDKALKPRVWLKSGGYLVINQTEALVAIDVNTGKFVGKGNARLEDTITRTNMEAVDEIARQIRLRDLGGIIVLDLIDMEDRRNRNKVSQALQEALASDKSPNKVLSFNDFGLIIMTRKRVKQSLERTMCAPCDYCEGSGWVKSPITTSYEILVEARRLSKSVEDVRHTTLRVHPDVANALRNSEREVMEEIEAYLGNVDITSDKSIHQAQFDFAFI